MLVKEIAGVGPLYQVTLDKISISHRLPLIRQQLKTCNWIEAFEDPNNYLIQFYHYHDGLITS